MIANGDGVPQQPFETRLLSWGKPSRGVNTAPTEYYIPPCFDLVSATRARVLPAPRREHCKSWMHPNRTVRAMAFGSLELFRVLLRRAFISCNYILLPLGVLGKAVLAGAIPPAIQIRVCLASCHPAARTSSFAGLMPYKLLQAAYRGAGAPTPSRVSSPPPAAGSSAPVAEPLDSPCLAGVALGRQT